MKPQDQVKMQESKEEQNLEPKPEQRAEKDKYLNDHLEEILWSDEDEELEDQALAESGSAVSRESETLAFELPEGIRLDVGVTEALGRTRSFVQSLIEEGRVQVNGSVKKSNYKIRPGDQIGVEIPPPRELKVDAENIPLEVVYEDEDVLVVNKRQGMVVHPAPGAWNRTLVNALLYHCQNLSGINGVLRPGIVHRIDKDTSGLLVVAKNDRAHQGLAAQIKEHSMARKYIALVHGVVLESTGTVDAPIGRDSVDRKKMAVTFHNSRAAVTHYEVLERFHDFTYLRAQLETGRTHQIRVHMAYLKHPVLGDPLYGPKKNPFGLEGQMLHAEHLGFVHPRTGEWLEFTVKPPAIFGEIIKQLKIND